jgi:hypothetical protein
MIERTDLIVLEERYGYLKRAMDHWTTQLENIQDQASEHVRNAPQVEELNLAQECQKCILKFVNPRVKIDAFLFEGVLPPHLIKYLREWKGLPYILNENLDCCKLYDSDHDEEF